MPKAPEVKPGYVIELEGQQYVVRKVDVHSPSARGAATLYKMTLNELVSKRKRDVVFKGDDVIALADAQNKSMQYLYAEATMHTFMAADDYSQYLLSTDDLGEQLLWLHEGMEGLTGLLVNDDLVAIELPQSIVKKITDTAPGIKGASASARTKSALLEGGISIQVPEYIEQGELVKVNTETKKFMSRA